MTPGEGVETITRTDGTDQGVTMSRPGHRGFYSLFWLGQGVTRVGILVSLFLCFLFLCFWPCVVPN